MEDKGRAKARPFGLGGGMKRGAWVAFAVLCVLSGSAWLLTPVPGWVRGLVYLVVAVGAVLLNGRARWNRSGSVARLALITILLVALPEAMAGWAVGHVANAFWSVTLAVIPAIVVLVVAQGSEEMDARRLLVPAVAALGGLLLLVPVDLPWSTMAWLSLAAMGVSAVLLSIGAVLSYRVLQGFNLVQAVAVYCFSNSLVLFVVAYLGGWRGGLLATSWVAVLVAGIEIVLLVALLQSMVPTRLAGRFLIAPLVTIVEGYVLLRPELTLRMGVGAALLGGGAAMLLMRRDTDGDVVVSLH